MPQGETFWNPYRWVPAPQGQPPRRTPAYRHKFQGLGGRFECRLKALTPLLIGDGGKKSRSQNEIHFVRHGQRAEGEPYVPATSLKGMFRSLLELAANAAVPSGQNSVDVNHLPTQAASRSGADWQLDAAARLFGYLNAGDVNTGLVQISDGRLVSQPLPPARWPKYVVEIGSPKSEHSAFYPSRKDGRKFYHHQPGAAALRPVPAGIDQKRTVVPAPPETEFRFSVAFQNLKDDELSLLTYILFLEEDATVNLSAEAAGGQAVTLRGPLRHKLGGCKPLGGGSVQISPCSLTVTTNLASRYSGKTENVQIFTDSQLTTEVQRRVAKVRDLIPLPTYEALKAMLVYDLDDPRGKALRYPPYSWFRKQDNKTVPLKPTI